MEIVPAVLAENFDDCVKILRQAESFIDLGVDYVCVGSRTFLTGDPKENYMGFLNKVKELRSDRSI